MDTRSASQRHASIRSVREERQRRIRKTIERGRRRKRIREALKEIIPGACIGDDDITGLNERQKEFVMRTVDFGRMWYL